MSLKSVFRTIEYFKWPYRMAKAFFWSVLFGFPARKLKLIFVTGTDGKTTTCNFIYNILKTHNGNVGIVSTIYANTGKRSVDTGFHVTTPGPFLLNKLLREMVRNGCEYAVIEVTSHAINQYKVFGMTSEVVVITNVTREHLDYHRNYQNYLNTKSKLLKSTNYAVINGNDLSTSYLKEKCESTHIKYKLFNSTDAKDLFSAEWGARYPGGYNLENAASSLKVAEILGIERNVAVSAIEKSIILDGRFNIVHAPDKRFQFTVVVDFAHTPNALQKLLLCSKEKYARVITVFGSAGERDKGKRPLMGDVVSSLSNVSIITAEDPRKEKVEDICREIEVGMIKNAKILNKDYFVIYDRYKAIEFALRKLARREDLVLITGKGHEKSMCYGRKELPWSDSKAVEEILKIYE